MSTIPQHAGPQLVSPGSLPQLRFYFELESDKVKNGEYAEVYKITWNVDDGITVLTPPADATDEEREEYIFRVYDPLHIFWGTGRDEGDPDAYPVVPVVPGTRGWAEQRGALLHIVNMDCP